MTGSSDGQPSQRKYANVPVTTRPKRTDDPARLGRRVAEGEQRRDTAGGGRDGQERGMHREADGVDQVADGHHRH